MRADEVLPGVSTSAGSTPAFCAAATRACWPLGEGDRLGAVDATAGREDALALLRERIHLLVAAAGRES